MRDATERQDKLCGVTISGGPLQLGLVAQTLVSPLSMWLDGAGLGLHLAVEQGPPVLHDGSCSRQSLKCLPQNNN